MGAANKRKQGAGSGAGDARAPLRAKVRRLPRKYKHPPDQAEGAVKQVIEQRELLAPGAPS